MLALANRLITKVAVRGALVMAPAVAHDEIPVVDLRGKLPVDGQYDTRPIDGITHIIIHHSATKGQTIRSIAEFHVSARGWPAIAYHFAVGYDGKIFILHDIDEKTFHAQGWNTKAVGVCLIGNYQDREVPPEVIHSCERLVLMLREAYDIPYVLFHRDTKPTACPGSHAVEALQFLKDGRGA